MKNMSYCVAFIFLLLGIQACHAMEKGAKPIAAQIEVYFSPEHRYYMKYRLLSLLDNAKNAIYIAIYWLTDTAIINKLIELQAHGIAINIILDSSSPNITDTLRMFIEKNITPLIHPSETGGYMHNKFIVIDNTITMTGSANFTRAAFDTSLLNYNYENMVIISSKTIAEEFHAEFLNIQRDIFKSYIDIVAHYDQKIIPEWLQIVGPLIYHTKSRFPQALYIYTKERNFNENKKTKVLNFFAQ